MARSSRSKASSALRSAPTSLRVQGGADGADGASSASTRAAPQAGQNLFFDLRSFAPQVAH